MSAIEEIAETLTRMRADAAAADDSAAWRMAIFYTERLPDAQAELVAAGKPASVSAADRILTARAGYAGPPATWLDHAAKTRRVFPELFGCATKPVSYWTARFIATSRVKDPHAMLEWAVRERPTDRQLRNQVRVDVDGISPVIKPSDLWTFAPPAYGRIDGEEGHGYIPGDLYVNILWHWHRPHDLVADVMAGSGMLHHVWERRSEWMPRDVDMPLTIRLFDLNPRGPYADRIEPHDAREPLPVRPNLAIADVPYFKITAGQYSEKPEDIANADLPEAWAAMIGQVAVALASVQEDEDRVAVVVPNYHDLKEGRFMTAALVREVFSDAGYSLADIAYSGRAIQRAGRTMLFVNRQAKERRVMLSEISEILLFERQKPDA
jgi:hypothetical protein